MTPTKPSRPRIVATPPAAKARRQPAKPSLSRQSLYAAVATELRLNKSQAKRSVDCVVAAIKKFVAAGHRVEVRGFGTWELRTSKPRKGRNPKTGVAVQVPAKTRVKAVASPRFLKVATRAKTAAK